MSKKNTNNYSKEDLERYTLSELKREEEGATGFSVDIVYDCPHQDSDLVDLPITAVTKAFSSNCKHCTEDDENWMCMKCGDVCCSRYKNAHMAKHHQDTKHNITMSLVDLSFWCYGCYSYIESRRTRSIRGFASAIKFGNISVSEETSSAAASGSSSSSSSTTTTSASASSSESKGKKSASHTEEEEDLEKYSREDLEREQRGETGFNINVAYDCPHIQDHFSQMKVQTLADALSATCTDCSEKEENWLCLKCGKTFCSRYKNAHMKQHNEQSGHLLAFSLTDFSAWCYSCCSYVESGRIKQLRNVASGLKFNNIEISDPKPQRPKGSTSHATEAEVKEHFDDEKKMAEDAKKLANLLKSCKHCVVYTGAGISTSAKIPDYRGPQGVWTLRDKGLSAPGIDIEQAFPTYGHYAIQELVRTGIVKYVVSTNVDGLHRRSGVPEDKIAELHGNCYREVCEKCKKEYLRGFDVTKTVKVYTNHITGRKCACGGALKDTIIHFSENLPEKELELAVKHSEQADVSLVLGTSMRVAPACKLPLYTLQKNGNLIIVNLQITPYDKKSTLRSFSKTDEFLRLVMKELGKETFDTSFDALEDLKK